MCQSEQMRVAIVEDNRDAAESFALLLQSEGCDARAVFCSDEAETLVRDWMPHMLFVDIGLPYKDGFSLVQDLKSAGLLESVYVVALTGYNSPVDLERANAGGFHEYLVKPAELEDVLRVLRDAARRRNNFRK